MENRTIVFFSARSSLENFHNVIHMVVTLNEWKQLLTEEIEGQNVWKERIESGLIKPLPTLCQRLPITYYQHSETITEMIRYTMDMWQKVLGYEMTECWLPQAAYSPGLDKWLIEQNITKTFVPKKALALAKESGEGASNGVTMRGLHLVGYEERDGKYYTEKEDEYSLLHVEFTYDKMYEGASLLEEVEVKTLLLWTSLEKIAAANGMAKWLVHRLDDVVLTEGYISSLHEELTSMVASIEGVKQKQSDLKRIAILTWEYPPNSIGGLSTHVYHLAKNLVKEQVQVTIFTPNKQGKYEKSIEDGVEVIRVNVLHEKDAHFLDWVGSLNVAMTRAIQKEQQQSPFQLIHVHDWLVAEAGKVCATEFAIPLISTIHSTEYGRNNGIHTSLQSFVFKQEQALLAASQKVLLCHSSLKEELKLGYESVWRENSVRIIPNGMDDEPKNPPLYHRLHSLFQRMPMFTALARFVPEKGLETLLEAIFHLKQEGIRAGVILAGVGPLQEQLAERVVTLGLQNEVFFPGYVTEEERAVLMTKSAAVVIPSTYEPFGLVAVEAFSYHIPVIAANVGGLKGIVQDGVSGYLFAPNDAVALGEKMKEMLAHPERAKQFGDNGNKMAKSLYSWKRHAKDTKACYEDSLTEFKVKELVR